jgi:hypothetical protein
MDSYAFGRTMAAAWAAFSLVAAAGGTAAEPPATTTAPETASVAMCSAGDAAAFNPQVYSVSPGPNAPNEIQERIIDSLPGDVIQLEAGRYQLPRQIDVAAAGLTIRGRGPSETVLSFKGQEYEIHEGDLSNVTDIADTALEENLWVRVTCLGRKQAWLMFDEVIAEAGIYPSPITGYGDAADIAPEEVETVREAITTDAYGVNAQEEEIIPPSEE